VRGSRPPSGNCKITGRARVTIITDVRTWNFSSARRARTSSEHIVSLSERRSCPEESVASSCVPVKSSPERTRRPVRFGGTELAVKTNSPRYRTHFPSKHLDQSDGRTGIRVSCVTERFVFIKSHGSVFFTKKTLPFNRYVY